LLLSVLIFLPHPFFFCKRHHTVSRSALERKAWERPGESIIERPVKLCYKTAYPKTPAPETMRTYDISS
jgi:hypothetical protein